MVDAFVVEAVEREFVIDLPAFGVDDSFHLEFFQLGLAIGGDALADSLVVAISRIVMNAQILGDPCRREAEPEQTGYLTAIFRRRLVATPPGTMAEQLAAALAPMPPVGAALVTPGTLDATLTTLLVAG